MRVEPPAQSPPEAVEHVEKELGGESQRVDVDALVVAVKPAQELAERDLVTEQAGAIGGDATLAVEATVGAAGDQAGHHRRFWIGDPDRVAECIP